MAFSLSLPPVKWILLFVVLSAIPPMHYLLFLEYPPEGFVFVGMGGDDSEFFTSMRLAEMNFADPWGVDDSMSLGPSFGPIYIFVPLGFVSLLSGVPHMSVFLSFMFLSALFFLFVLYNFIRFLVPVASTQSLLVYILTAGAGGLFILLFRLLTTPADLLAPAPLYGFGEGFLRILGSYKLLPLATSFLSMAYFQTRQTIKSGVFLGLTAVFFPPFALAAAALNFLHALIQKSGVRLFAKIVVVSLPFAVLWILPLLLFPRSVSGYVEGGFVVTSVFLPTFMVSLGVPLLLAAYEIYSKHRSVHGVTRVAYAVVWLLSLALFSLSNLSHSYWTYANSDVSAILSSLQIMPFLQAISAFSFLLEIPLLLLLVKAFYNTLKSEKNETLRFVISWLFIVFIAVLLPSRIFSSLPAKMIPLLWFPLCVLAASGILRLSRIYKIPWQKLFIAVFIISLPSAFLFNAFTQTGVRSLVISQNIEECCFFYSTDDYAAFEFLGKQEPGMVLAPAEIGTWLPFLSLKKTLFHVHVSNHVSDAEEKLADYENFYSGAETEKERILQKYKIRYIFFSSYDEKRFEVPKAPFLRLLFESGRVKVYEYASAGF